MKQKNAIKLALIKRHSGGQRTMRDRRDRRSAERGRKHWTKEAW